MAKPRLTWRDVLNAQTTYAHQAVPMARALGYRMFAWAGCVWRVPPFGNRPISTSYMAGEIR